MTPRTNKTFHGVTFIATKERKRVKKKKKTFFLVDGIFPIDPLDLTSPMRLLRGGLEPGYRWARRG